MPDDRGDVAQLLRDTGAGVTANSAEEIARAVDSIGGNLDAFTSKELVSFNTKVLDEHLPRAFDILSDLVLNPAFQPGDIRKEQGVVLEELKMETDNPEYLVKAVMSGVAGYLLKSSSRQELLDAIRTGESER